MLRADGRLQRWEGTDDVCQNALMRLCRALQDITPGSVREFFRLAAMQVRRELIDLARHYYGPHGLAAKHQSEPFERNLDGTPQAACDRADSSQDPGQLAAVGFRRVEVGRRGDVFGGGALGCLLDGGLAGAG